MSIDKLNLPWVHKRMHGVNVMVDSLNHLVSLDDSVTLRAVAEVTNDYHMMFERHKAAQIKIVELMKRIEELKG